MPPPAIDGTLRDPGDPTQAHFLSWLAQRIGRRAGTLDCVLVYASPPPDCGAELVRRADLEDHPRVAFARGKRRDVAV